MKLAKVTAALGVLCAIGLAAAESANAQIMVFGPPVYGPRVVARPMLPPVPVVRAPVVTSYRVPVVSYSTPVTRYTSVVTTPLVTTPTYYRSVTRVRPAVIGTSVAGLPRAYVPGQPIRNAIRFSIP